MSGTMMPCPVASEDPKSDTFRCAKVAPELFEGSDVDGFVEGALDDHPVVPISEGTVQIRRFESPLLEPIPSTSSKLKEKPAPAAGPMTAPPWLLQLAGFVPARHEKAVVAGILFFFLFGVLSFLAGVTALLFML
jgi:hypothetical protein